VTVYTQRSTLMKSNMQKAIIQYWEESEEGWGMRPDGATLHKSLEDCQAYIKHYWTVVLKRNRGKGVPHEYSRPAGIPSEIMIPTAIYKKIESNGVRLDEDFFKGYEVESCQVLKKIENGN